jgi:hypothetical protein
MSGRRKGEGILKCEGGMNRRKQSASELLGALPDEKALKFAGKLGFCSSKEAARITLITIEALNRVSVPVNSMNLPKALCQTIILDTLTEELAVFAIRLSRLYAESPDMAQRISRDRAITSNRVINSTRRLVSEFADIEFLKHGTTNKNSIARKFVSQYAQRDADPAVVKKDERTARRYLSDWAPPA